MSYRLGSLAIVMLVLSLTAGCGRAGSVPMVNLTEATTTAPPNSQGARTDQSNDQPVLTPASDLETKKTPVERSYWPTEGWQSSTPEQQGMDSQALAGMLSQIQEQDYNIHSVLVIRNGFLVTEAYKHPYNAEARHILYSCTKSIISALIGIAIQEGYIQSVNEPVLDFFSEMEVANIDSDKQAMTLENLLTMASGFRCRDSYLYGWQDMRKMMRSEDWAKFVLDLPMSEAPGTRFEYCNGASHLLSTILTVSTGKSALEFAQSRLFKPLGITDVLWRSDPNGINLGSSGLQMKAADMGKIGYLYLNGGEWDGKQVVPDTWVQASTRAQIEAGTLQEGYGYQWWVDAQGVYMALGFAGQFIFVVPGQDIVAVFTSGLKGSDFGIPEQLLKQYIIPAALSDRPLPENPEGWAALQSQQEQLANPEPEPVPPLPQIAQTVSGNTYILDEDLLGFEAIGLEFDEDVDQALFRLTTSNGNLVLPVGLDGVFRVTPHELQLDTYFLHAPIALKGAWLDEDSFILFFQNVGSPDDIRFQLDIEDDEVLVQFTEETTSDVITVRGQIQK